MTKVAIRRPKTNASHRPKKCKAVTKIKMEVVVKKMEFIVKEKRKLSIKNKHRSYNQKKKLIKIIIYRPKTNARYQLKNAKQPTKNPQKNASYRQKK